MPDAGIRTEERRCIKCGQTTLHEIDAAGRDQCVRCRVLEQERAKTPAIVHVSAESRRPWRVLGLDLDDPVRVVGTILIVGIAAVFVYSCVV